MKLDILPKKQRAATWRKRDGSLAELGCFGWLTSFSDCSEQFARTAGLVVDEALDADAESAEAEGGSALESTTVGMRGLFWLLDLSTSSLERDLRDRRTSASKSP